MIAYCHHENFDGTGYPRGLKGEQIPLGARIFNLIDSYDAMRSPRVYKASLSKEKALEEIRRQSGRQFDPGIVSTFIQVVNQIEREGQWPNREKGFATSGISPRPVLDSGQEAQGIQSSAGVVMGGKE